MKKVFLFIIILLSVACSKQKDEHNTPQLTLKNLQKVDGPVTANRSQEITLNVFWYYNTGCDVFSKFEETRQGNIITIQSLGYYALGICTMDAGIKTQPFTFTSAQAGLYELRFVNRDNSVITHFVTVN